MTVPDGFHRTDVHALGPGDSVWFEGLHQSRTGMIARLPVSGRLLAVRPRRPALPWAASDVELELLDEFGDTHQFRLTAKDAVYILGVEPAPDREDAEVRDPAAQPPSNP